MARPDAKRLAYLKKLRENETPETKSCSRCERSLLLELFSKDKAGHKGRVGVCKECLSKTGSKDSVRAGRNRHLKELRQAETPATKLCNHCERILPSDLFSKNGSKNAIKGLASECNECRSKLRLKDSLQASRNRHLKELRKQESQVTNLCTICEKILNLNEFPKSKNSRKGVRNECKECQRLRKALAYNPENSREEKLIRNYGVSLEQYDAMLTSQDSCCKICGTDQPGHYGRFVVDHDHASDEIRGLLCNKCNVMLGMAGDNPVNLRRGAAYLEGYS